MEKVTADDLMGDSDMSICVCVKLLRKWSKAMRNYTIYTFMNKYLYFCYDKPL